MIFSKRLNNVFNTFKLNLSSYEIFTVGNKTVTLVKLFIPFSLPVPFQTPSPPGGTRSPSFDSVAN